MSIAEGGEEKWLLREISSFNVPVKTRYFPKESSVLLRQALGDVLFLALSLHKSSRMAFNSHAVFVLFPRIIFRPLPNGCQGGLATTALSRRCTILRDRDLVSLLKKAHEAQTVSVAKALAEATAPKPSFTRTTRAAILAKVGAVGRACKPAFSYGLESDPVIAAGFLAKLTLHHRHSHIPIYDSKVAPRPNYIPLKAVTDAFSGMSKKPAAHRDG
jgi:hypothetical protein